MISLILAAALAVAPLQPCDPDPDLSGLLHAMRESANLLDKDAAKHVLRGVTIIEGYQKERVKLCGRLDERAEMIDALTSRLEFRQGIIDADAQDRTTLEEALKRERARHVVPRRWGCGPGPAVAYGDSKLRGAVVFACIWSVWP